MLFFFNIFNDNQNLQITNTNNQKKILKSERKISKKSRFRSHLGFFTKQKPKE